MEWAISAVTMNTKLARNRNNNSLPASGAPSSLSFYSDTYPLRISSLSASNVESAILKRIVQLINMSERRIE
jgi:hypothetical protein